MPLFFCKFAEEFLPIQNPWLMRNGFLIVCLLAVFAATSCVYDFHPDWQGQAGYVAIEGDILIGDTSRFDVRFSTDLEDKNNVGTPLTYTLRVEASDGTVYSLRDSLVDLTAADASLEYRLVVAVSAPFQKTYASQWAPVQITPPIDSLSWSVEDDKSKLWINVSTHSGNDPGYYRWQAAETWEYHATYYATHFFAPAGTEYKGTIVPYDTILEYQNGDNTFFCWDSADRDDILLGSTVELSEDRLVDYGIYAFDPKDRRVSHIYFVALSQIRLTEVAYRFWDVLRTNSSDVGGLFSPEPSELRGNIVNIDDPDELVLGYISVATCSRARLFVDNDDTLFSRWRGRSAANSIVFPFPADYRKYYGWQYRVGWLEGSGGYTWLPGECVDCRFSGGTKERPSWWINDDK